MRVSVWGAIITLLLGTGVARAADLPVKALPPPAPVFSWTGFYLGGDVGARGAIVDPSVTSAIGAIAGPPGNLFPAACPAAGCVNGPSLDTTGFRGGVFAGYNYQIGPQWVIGIEGDWAWAHRRNTVNGSYYPNTAFAGPNFLAGFGPAVDAFYSVTTKWDASVRGRVGFLVTPTVLLYLTGGVSWLKVEQSSNCPVSFCGPVAGSAVLGPALITHSSVIPGWTVGGGGEMRLWGNWLARAEYRYTDYGNWGNTDVRACSSAAVGCLFLTGTGLTVGTNVRIQTHTGLVGLAYKF